MTLLIQFLLRLSFGLATGMAITSSKQVTSGYFRNHLYVTLGLTSFAAVLSHQFAPEAFWYAVAAAAASYVGAVGWLYEKATFGKTLLVLVTLCSLLGTLQPMERAADSAEQASTQPVTAASNEPRTTPASDDELAEDSHSDSQADTLQIPARISSGLLLGLTIASMLLGHWYLNSPTMEMAPLRRLLLAMAAAVALRVVLASLGLWGELAYAPSVSGQWLAFVVLRWSFGLVGVAVLAWMAWQTLKIPNTQSATGILYVAVIGTFVGETMALLLSSESLFPL
ncbi:MAG: hypothetical protein KDA57_12155 [Planctomycetales bacterium]|nr:hypothetical protein [Planctomycetales bacterium]